MTHWFGCPGPSTRSWPLCTSLVTTWCKFYRCSKSMRNIAHCMYCERWIPVPLWRNYNMIGKSESSQPWLSESVVTSAANLAVFPQIWACFFVELRFFLKTCGLLVFGLVLIEICVFFGLVFCRFLFCRLPFFQILWHFCCLNLLLKAYWACFCEDLLILGLFFRICHPDSLFDFLANFSICWIFLPTHFGLVFRLNFTYFWLVFQIYLLVLGK